MGVTGYLHAQATLQPEKSPWYNLNTRISGSFISVINQLDVQNFCFKMSLFHASACFEQVCSSSEGQNCIIPIGVMIPEAV